MRVLIYATAYLCECLFKQVLIYARAYCSDMFKVLVYSLLGLLWSCNIVFTTSSLVCFCSSSYGSWPHFVLVSIVELTVVLASVMVCFACSTLFLHRLVLAACLLMSLRACLLACLLSCLHGSDRFCQLLHDVIVHILTICMFGREADEARQGFFSAIENTGTKARRTPRLHCCAAVEESHGMEFCTHS